jgi:hypothetical protein
MTYLATGCVVRRHPLRRETMATLRITSLGPSDRPDDLTGHLHRQLLGYIGLVLPLVLIVLVRWRDSREVWDALDSVSAYYYTGAVAAFTGMLVAFALFLFTYKGYGRAPTAASGQENKPQIADRVCAVVAGVAALLVALFPTSAPDTTGITALTWVKPWVVRLHFFSAIVLFGTFAVFCLWLFRKTAEGETPDAGKKWRNGIYTTCGLVIIACIGWGLYNGLTRESIFWPESVALFSFALSWLVKGYALRSAMAVARSLFSP